MKKFLLILVVILLVAITIPYGKNQDNSNEIIFWTLQMSDFSPYMNKVIKEFEEQNPEIKIKWVDVPFSEGEKRTLASILSTTPPDLVNLTPDFSSVLAQKQALHYIDCNKLDAYNPLNSVLCNFIFDFLQQKNT